MRHAGAYWNQYAEDLPEANLKYTSIFKAPTHLNHFDDPDPIF